MSEKKTRLLFSIEPSLKAKAQEFAKEKNISLAALIRKLLFDCVGGSQTLEDQVAQIMKETIAIKKRLEILENNQEEK